MVFTEQKTGFGYLYKVDDVFGEMEFVSPMKLKPETLDKIFLAIFNIKSNTEIIEGDVKGTGIRYKFKKAKQWDKLDEEKEEGSSWTSGYIPPKQKRKMPSSLKRYWYRQDMTMVSLGLILGAIIVSIVWLISLNK